MKRPGVGEDLAFEFEPFALREHRHAVIGDGAAEQNHVARPRIGGGDRDTRPAPGRCRSWSRRACRPSARLTTFVSPVTIATPAAAAAVDMASTTRDSSSISKPFLDDESRREAHGNRATHGEVVDRAIDRELADIAAREKERSDHEGIGRKGDAGRADFDDGLVVEFTQQRIVESGEKQVANQLRGQSSAAAVAHDDGLMLRQRKRAGKRKRLAGTA